MSTIKTKSPYLMKDLSPAEPISHKRHVTEEEHYKHVKSKNWNLKVEPINHIYSGHKQSGSNRQYNFKKLHTTSVSTLHLTDRQQLPPGTFNSPYRSLQQHNTNTKLPQIKEQMNRHDFQQLSTKPKDVNNPKDSKLLSMNEGAIQHGSGASSQPSSASTDRRTSIKHIWDSKPEVHFSDASPQSDPSLSGNRTSDNQSEASVSGNSALNKNKSKLSIFSPNLLHFMIHGQLKKSAKDKARSYQIWRHETLLSELESSKQSAASTRPAAKPEPEDYNPVKALDTSLDKLDRFIKTNLADDNFLYRQQVMPVMFKTNEKFKFKAKIVQQALKMEELLVCIQDRRKRNMIKKSRVSPDGASFSEVECTCDCHRDTLNNQKGTKGKGKGKSKKPKPVCEIDKVGNMTCCCGKRTIETEEAVVITPESESSVTEPEVVLTDDVSIQVNVQELKNNIIVVKPKMPRFVSVYLEAPDESTPRYMLAKNIHHKDRTQYTYIENKERIVGETSPSRVKNDLVNSPSGLIHVKESKSSHDFSERETLLDHSESNVVDISFDIRSEDGFKWNRGVDTLELEHLLAEKEKEEEEIRIKEMTTVEESSNPEFGTNDSGIETIDLDSVSEIEVKKPETEVAFDARLLRDLLRLKEPEIIQPGSPADVSNIKTIPIEKVKGEPIVPKNRGTIIDHTHRLTAIQKIYDPFGIDYSRVRINRQGKIVYMRDKATPKPNPNESITSQNTSYVTADTPLSGQDVSHISKTNTDLSNAPSNSSIIHVKESHRSANSSIIHVKESSVTDLGTRSQNNLQSEISLSTTNVVNHTSSKDSDSQSTVVPSNQQVNLVVDGRMHVDKANDNVTPQNSDLHVNSDRHDSPTVLNEQNSNGNIIQNITVLADTPPAMVHKELEDVLVNQVGSNVSLNRIRPDSSSKHSVSSMLHNLGTKV